MLKAYECEIIYGRYEKTLGMKFFKVYFLPTWGHLFVLAENEAVAKKIADNKFCNMENISMFKGMELDATTIPYTEIGINCVSVKEISSTYSLDYLRENLSADDFMKYVKDRYTAEEFVSVVIR